MDKEQIYLSNLVSKHNKEKVMGEYVTLLGESYYCIKNYDKMPPFFMSIVSSSDHWLFISSTGSLSAGRQNAQSALFPYYTVDKITENSENTGNKTILLVHTNNHLHLWEPFSMHYAGLYNIERNLYKNVYGNKLLFEEINHDLSISYRYAWSTSEKYGFIKTSWFINNSDQELAVSLLDGLQNILPYGANAYLQSNLSNLLDAYKRNELELQTGLGIFAINAALTDVAEPAESLKATVAYQIGLKEPKYLLSTGQLANFKKGLSIEQESDIRGKRGAYFVHAVLELPPQTQNSWSLVAEINQDSTQITKLVDSLKDKDSLKIKIEQDIKQSSKELKNIIASSDGLQVTGDELTTAHHYANVLFNTMRGGIFADGYIIQKADLLNFIKVRNTKLLANNSDFFAALPKEFSHSELISRVLENNSADLERICCQYLPLTFSRRHGDPSRPWNRFSINIKNPDGSKKLDYQGNWRDIFQNWEPLAYSYPEFIEGMICKFLNATTADGYNPYRVMRAGIEWEEPEPDNPLVNIGYWSDHQIIYLQKLMEVSLKFHPQVLTELLSKKIFAYANVPYRIKKYNELLKDWYNTIDFNWQLDKEINSKVSELGTDAKLLLDANGKVFHVNLTEKLLILLLAKLANFIPEGGIWMNTQRPEWNDANNALVGKGISVVTTSYLRRYLVFIQELLKNSDEIEITKEVKGFFEAVFSILERHKANLASSFSDSERRIVMDELGQAGSNYRWHYYEQGFSGEFTGLDKSALLSFLKLAQQYVEHTLQANKRADNLYHSYNVLKLGKDTTTVEYLYEMLEGQVAVLSSGFLSSKESLKVLNALRNSKMYRKDQHSYMLYPNRDLPGFLNKNNLSQEQIQDSKLVAKLIENRDISLISKDIKGIYHFNGEFKNAKDVKRALANLGQQEDYSALVKQEEQKVLGLFEEIFDHDSFTGRSGTFFAYEGLGSIYWHMVSKLLLAVQENYLEASESSEVMNALYEGYYDVRRGIGFNKTPDVYGAFPTDPYSHTPYGQGAKQPGMTGQVKEEILTRLAELGLFVEDGELVFNFALTRSEEWLEQPIDFNYVDVKGNEQTINLPANSLAYTFCQVPIVCVRSGEKSIKVSLVEGKVERIVGNHLESKYAQHIFKRDSVIKQLEISSEYVDD